MKKLEKKIRIQTTIELVTGLHVGGSSDNIEIGGIDNPVIKIATKDNQPYIPGSSIKGKMRCLLEQIAGVELGGDEDINNLFGYAAKNMPSKIIVRDALLAESSAHELRNCEDLDMPYTEGKWENSIDRIKGIALNPRQTERVPAGVSFCVEFIINVWDSDDENKLFTLLEKGIEVLENDYLGGNGSRGYGQIKFGALEKKEFSESNNWSDK